MPSSVLEIQPAKFRRVAPAVKLSIPNETNLKGILNKQT